MTSRRSLRTYGARIAKAAFSFSLLLGCLTWGADDPAALRRAIEGKSDMEALRTLARMEAKGQLEGKLSSEVQSLKGLLGSGNISREAFKRRMAEIRGIVELHANIPTASSGEDPVALAKRIKSSPMYRDPGLKEQANWLSGAASRLNEIRWQPDCDEPEVQHSPPSFLGDVVLKAVWGVLGLGVAVFLYFALRHFTWARRLERRAKAMLDEDEPERTLDEWLELAAKLEAEGRYREAVRCLYLACLLKIDEARIARFERGQTNWEHLARIEASPHRPPSLNFRAPTKAFDEIWYGMRVKGVEDLDRFRAWYREITELTRAKAA